LNQNGKNYQEIFRGKFAKKERKCRRKKGRLKGGEEEGKTTAKRGSQFCGVKGHLGTRGRIGE